MEANYQKILTELTRFFDGLDLRSRIYKQLGCNIRSTSVMDWILLSREGKIKIIEELKNNSIKENMQIFPLCFINKTSEFYVDKIDFLITYADKRKVKLKVIEEGIVVMIMSIGLAEEVKSLNKANRELFLPLLKEKLLKEEKFGIPFEKCLEEVLNIKDQNSGISL